jgi:hypothetical protein
LYFCLVLYPVNTWFLDFQTLSDNRAWRRLLSLEWEDWDKPLRRAILAIVLCPPMQSGAALGGSSSERKQSPVEERAGVGGGTEDNG